MHSPKAVWRLTLKGRFTSLIGALLLAALIPLLAACGGPDTVVIATTADYHPFNFINDEGEIDGLERELGTNSASALVCSVSGS